MIDYSNGSGFKCPAIIPWVYENTSPDSKLRRLMVTFVRWDFDEAEVEVSKTFLCPEFVYDLATSFFRDKDTRENDDGFRVELSLPKELFCDRYHDHPTKGPPCQLQKGFAYHDPDDD